MKSAIKQILREGIIVESRVKLNMPIPNDIKQIKDIFVKNGYKFGFSLDKTIQYINKKLK